MKANEKVRVKAIILILLIATLLVTGIPSNMLLKIYAAQITDAATGLICTVYSTDVRIDGFVAPEGFDGNLIIPSTIAGKKVAFIGVDCFKDITNLKSITLPDGITYIGTRAFKNCIALESIAMPDSVISVGLQAFDGCSSLKSITLPSNITRIYSNTFNGCSSLTSIVIPSGVTSIGLAAFRDCTKLESITLPSGVLIIEVEAFLRCYSLKSIVIPNGVTCIENWTFESCSSLESITIPSSVLSIGVNAFKNCIGLDSITVPSSVTSIGDNAFANCADSLTINCYRGSAIHNYAQVNAIKFNTLLNCVINPETAVFDKKHSNRAHISTLITYNSPASVADVKEAGGLSIGLESYRVSGSILTIDKEYLAAKDIGSLSLTIEFNTGDEAVLTIDIIETPTPASALTADIVGGTSMVEAGAANEFILTVKDSHGNTDTSFNGTIRTQIHAQNGSYGSFNGNEFNMSTGAGRYSDIVFIDGVGRASVALKKAGGQWISFELGGMTPLFSSPESLWVQHDTPVCMKITQDIAAPAANGRSFAQQPVITLEDQYGNICDNDYTTIVTVSKHDGGSWTLTGATTAIARQGVISFSSLGAVNIFQVDAAQLAFNSGALTEVISVPVTLPACTTKAITGFSFEGLSPVAVGSINESAKTVALTVPNGTNAAALIPTIAHTGISISPDTGVLQDFTGPVVYTVTAGDGTTQEYVVTVRIAPQPPSSWDNDDGGSSQPQPPQQQPTVLPSNVSDAVIATDEEEQSILNETVKQENGITAVNIEIKPEAIFSIIQETINKKAEAGERIGSIIAIAAGSKDIDRLTVTLTGDIIKQLEANYFTLSVESSDVNYIIPAKEVGIDRVAEMLGIPKEDLKNISIDIRIDRVDKEIEEEILINAQAQEFVMVFPPVIFNITAKTTTTSGEEREVAITSFGQYIERIMELPEGVDPSKITTGILYNSDGSFSHIPTQVFKKEGKNYVKLKSLTNSIYAVIWNTIAVPAVDKHWSKKAVKDMASRLIIKNPDSFNPDGYITRGEFAEYITRALGLYRTGVAKELHFNDVELTDELADAIAIAVQYGIITGYPDGSFRPNAQISRQEAMTMYARAMDILKLEDIDEERMDSFIDKSSVSEWAYSYVKKTLGAGVFNGKTPRTIDPKGTFTFAEAATAIRNLLIKAGMINK